MLSNISKKPLWVHVLIAMAFVALLLFCFLQLLGLITRHGQYLQVPSLVGMKTAEAVKLLEQKGFDVLIQDSAYVDSLKKGTVMKQLPEANSTVKVNRTVYLTVNRVTLPLVDMPSLEGKSFGFALEIIKRSHLLLGDTVYKPDFMRGSVLQQSFKGRIIASGEKVPWGSRIDLVIGSGLSGEKIVVPELVGLTFEEAKILLEQYGLALGSLVLDPGIADTASAYVYRQQPEKENENKEPVYIQPGQWMDIWLSQERKLPIDSITD